MPGSLPPRTSTTRWPRSCKGRVLRRAPFGGHGPSQKFGEVVERATGHVPDLPYHLAECLDKKIEVKVIPPTYEALKRYLLA